MSYDSGQSGSPSQWKIGEVFTIIIVWSIFFIFIYYGLFKSLFLIIYRAITTRNLVQRRLLEGSNSNPRDPSLQLESCGLDLSVVHTLPMSQFKKNEGEQKGSNADCAICLGEFEEGEWLKHLPYCTHVFHGSCIDTWFQSNSNCPLCRSYVLHDYFPDNIDHVPSSEDIFHSL